MMKPKNINNLHTKVRELILEARSTISLTVNFVSVIQNWEIGRMIVEDEQRGEAKAEYGKFVIKELAFRLKSEFGNGYSETHLRYCRQFYDTFPICHALRDKLEISNNVQNIIRHSLRDKTHFIYQILNKNLSWTHYRSLLSVENHEAREFYMKEAVENNWGTRALDRQINSLYYERLLSSQDKKPVIDEMKEKTATLNPEDVLKDPYILEFLELKDNTKFRESELEEALIDKLNHFLLELGKGFAFVARQKHISTETQDFYIDLIFYNYLLKCFVIIDLKIGKLKHQDIGQLDMYVRLYENKYKAPDDNPTIGIILCTQKDETIVKYSLMNESKQLFASKYKTYLPTEEELKETIELQKHYFETEHKNKH